MFGFVKGLTGTVVKTAVGLPVTVVADVVTLGGTLTDKRGKNTYTGDMLNSIGESIDEMDEGD